VNEFVIFKGGYHKEGIIHAVGNVALEDEITYMPAPHRQSLALTFFEVASPGSITLAESRKEIYSEIGSDNPIRSTKYQGKVEIADPGGWPAKIGYDATYQYMLKNSCRMDEAWSYYRDNYEEEATMITYGESRRNFNKAMNYRKSKT
jgi:hypothetical protein